MTYPPDAPMSPYRDDQTATYPGPVTQTPPGFGSDVADTSTTGVAKEQAAEVGQSSAQAGQHVAETAKDQVGQVAEQAKTEVKNLAGHTKDEVTNQAGAQQQRVAQGLRSLGSELHTMAANSDNDGPATQVARQAAERVSSAASWLEGREPGQVLSEVQRFARQRPGAFLAIAVTTGVVAGRLTRGLAADSSSSQTSSVSGRSDSMSSYTGVETEGPDNGWQTTGTPAGFTAADPAAGLSGAGSEYAPGPVAPAAPPATAWTEQVPPPAEGGYPPAEGGYPPAEGGYPPAEGGYPTPGTGGYDR